MGKNKKRKSGGSRKRKGRYRKRPYGKRFTRDPSKSEPHPRNIYQGRLNFVDLAMRFPEFNQYLITVCFNFFNYYLTYT